MENIYLIASDDDFLIRKNIEKIKRGSSTGFITLNVYKDVIKYLKKNDYKVYYPYLESEKVIIYSNCEPEVKLFRIERMLIKLCLILLVLCPITSVLSKAALSNMNLEVEVLKRQINTQKIFT